MTSWRSSASATRVDPAHVRRAELRPLTPAQTPRKRRFNRVFHGDFEPPRKSLSVVISDFMALVCLGDKVHPAPRAAVSGLVAESKCQPPLAEVGGRGCRGPGGTSLSLRSRDAPRRCNSSPRPPAGTHRCVCADALSERTRRSTWSWRSDTTVLMNNFTQLPCRGRESGGRRAWGEAMHFLPPIPGGNFMHGLAQRHSRKERCVQSGTGGAARGA